MRTLLKALVLAALLVLAFRAGRESVGRVAVIRYTDRAGNQTVVEVPLRRLPEIRLEPNPESP